MEEYNASIISICFTLLLGFTDDVLELRWSVKILLSAIATLPLLVGYYGPTNIIVPLPLRSWFGLSIQLGLLIACQFSSSQHHLGPLYHLYMLLISVFCTNSINIYAGINGLEVGQSIVIATSVALHNVLQLVDATTESSEHHFLSLLLMLPFIAVSLSLFAFNK